MSMQGEGAYETYVLLDLSLSECCLLTRLSQVYRRVDQDHLYPHYIYWVIAIR